MILPEDSEIITNLNKQIDNLRIQSDEIEASKDVLEEEFTQKESETQFDMSGLVEE